MLAPAERLIAYTLADYPEYHAWLADLFLGQMNPVIHAIEEKCLPELAGVSLDLEIEGKPAIFLHAF